MHVLDPDLLDVKLVDKASQLLKGKWPGTNNAILSGLTFRSVDKQPITFINEHRPLRRVLYFHARQARKMAIEEHWVKPDWDFDKFGSEGKMENIEAWLLNPTRLLPPGPLTKYSDSEELD